jgi:hypothetical protein
MGLGKTIQAIAFLTSLREVENVLDPFLIVGMLPHIFIITFVSFYSKCFTITLDSIDVASLFIFTNFVILIIQISSQSQRFVLI